MLAVGCKYAASSTEMSFHVNHWPRKPDCHADAMLTVWARDDAGDRQPYTSLEVSSVWLMLQEA